MRNNLPNILAFVLLAVGLTAGWWYVDKTFFPPAAGAAAGPDRSCGSVPREPAAALAGRRPSRPRR